MEWLQRLHGTLVLAQTAVGSKIKQLSDDHLWKFRGLFELSWLFNMVGNCTEQKKLLTQALKLWRERGDDYWVAGALNSLASANRFLGLYEEGIQQAREALSSFERLGNKMEEVACLVDLAHLLMDNKQLDEAEETIIRSINLLKEGPEFLLCKSYSW